MLTWIRFDRFLGWIDNNFVFKLWIQTTKPILDKLQFKCWLGSDLTAKFGRFNKTIPGLDWQQFRFQTGLDLTAKFRQIPGLVWQTISLSKWIRFDSKISADSWVVSYSTLWKLEKRFVVVFDFWLSPENRHNFSRRRHNNNWLLVFCNCFNMVHCS